MKNIQKIIEKKANNLELTKEDFSYLINGIGNYAKDYQISSFLMAIKINGLTDNELFYYTQLLIESGNKVEKILPDFFDKHSTGGIGDKTTLILFPILIALKIKLFKISGRGLGYTGGTIDKLESIPNIKFPSSLKEALGKSKINGFSISNSKNDIVPADKYTYSLRDTSGSSQSLDLIAASIMSKKIVTGCKNIFIDLKVGSGAFMKNLSDAIKLGERLEKIAKKFNRDIFILYTNMNEPLGRNIGNSIEIKEAIEFLDDYTKADPKLVKLIFKISSEIYSKFYKESLETSNQKIKEILESKEAKKSFVELIKKQDGDYKLVEENNVFKEKYKYEIRSKKDGFFKFKNLENLGFFLISLKAGRKKKNDNLDYHSGVIINYKNNDKIIVGELVAEIFSEFELKNKDLDFFEEKIFEIVENKSEPEEIILLENKWKVK